MAKIVIKKKYFMVIPIYYDLNGHCHYSELAALLLLSLSIVTSPPPHRTLPLARTHHKPGLLVPAPAVLAAPPRQAGHQRQHHLRRHCCSRQRTASCSRSASSRKADRRPPPAASGSAPTCCRPHTPSLLQQQPDRSGSQRRPPAPAGPLPHPPAAPAHQQAVVPAACRHAAAPQRCRPGPVPPPGPASRPSARCRRRSGSPGRPSAPAPPPSPPESTTKPNQSTSVLGPLRASNRGADAPAVVHMMSAHAGAPISPSPPPEPPPQTTDPAAYRQPPTPAQPIPPSRPRIKIFLAVIQPHRHLRSAAGLPCVLAVQTGLLAPVLPPETGETVIPASSRRTGLARTDWHFSACPADYQPAPKSDGPQTCTSRQCIHRDECGSQDRPSSARAQPRQAVAANTRNIARRDSPEERTEGQPRQSRPASLRIPPLPRSLAQATGPSGTPQ